VVDKVKKVKKKPDIKSGINENTHKNYIIREIETVLVQFYFDFYELF
jgi:hypothetical protein